MAPPSRQPAVSAGATIAPRPGPGAPTAASVPGKETSVFEGLQAQRLVAAFLAGWLLLNLPLLALWDHDITLGGLPLLPLMLFVLWAALIAAVAWIVERGEG